MEHRHLGRSGLRISPVALGTMNFGPVTPEAEAYAIMDRALDRGVTLFDTADVYGADANRTIADTSPEKGRTEEIIGNWYALEPDREKRILERNRAAVRAGCERFADWAGSLDGCVQAHRPMATPLVFARLRTELGSVDACERLRREASTLLAPGVYFGCEGYVRLNVGLGSSPVAAALEAMTPVVRAQRPSR
jgi:Aldo/keto reductase family